MIVYSQADYCCPSETRQLALASCSATIGYGWDSDLQVHLGSRALLACVYCPTKQRRCHPQRVHRCLHRVNALMFAHQQQYHCGSHNVPGVAVFSSIFYARLATNIAPESTQGVPPYIACGPIRLIWGFCPGASCHWSPYRRASQCLQAPPEPLCSPRQ